MKWLSFFLVFLAISLPIMAQKAESFDVRGLDKRLDSMKENELRDLVKVAFIKKLKRKVQVRRFRRLNTELRKVRVMFIRLQPRQYRRVARKGVKPIVRVALSLRQHLAIRYALRKHGIKCSRWKRKIILRVWKRKIVKLKRRKSRYIIRSVKQFRGFAQENPSEVKEEPKKEGSKPKEEEEEEEVVEEG